MLPEAGGNQERELELFVTSYTVTFSGADGGSAGV